MNGFRLNDEANDGNDDSEAEDFHDAIRKDAQQEEHRAFALTRIQQPVNPLDDGQYGIGVGGHVVTVMCSLENDPFHWGYGRS